MIVKESILRDILRLFIWFPYRWFIYIIPVKTALSFFKLMGLIHFLVNRSKKKLLKENIPESIQSKFSLNRIILKYMQTHYLDRMCVFLFPKLNAKRIQSIVRIDGLEHIDNALEKQKGVILIHSHFGPAQFSLFALAHQGYKMNQLGLRSDENISKIGKLQLKIRLKIEESSIPSNMLYVNKFMRPVFKNLKDNQLVMLPADATGGERFIGKYTEAGFLGRTMKFPIGWISLAEKTGAAVVPLSLHYDQHNTYRLKIHPPIDFINTNGEPVNIKHNLDQFLKILDDDIHHHPGSWHFWDEFYPGNLLVE